MKPRFGVGALLALTAALAGLNVCHASDLTYYVDQTGLPFGASVTGTITTNGTIGTLTTFDILSFNILINEPPDSYNVLPGLPPNPSGASVVGTDLTATATELLFDFDATDSGYFRIFQVPPGGSGLAAPGWFLEDASYVSNGVTLTTGSDLLWGFQPMTGTVEIASTPEPSGFLLLASGLLGLAYGVGRQLARHPQRPPAARPL